MQKAYECVTCAEAQPRGITGMSGSLPSRSEAPGAQQGGGRLLRESVERHPILFERRINKYRVGAGVEPQGAIDTSPSKLMAMGPSSNRNKQSSLRRCFSSFETAE